MQHLKIASGGDFLYVPRILRVFRTSDETMELFMCVTQAAVVSCPLQCFTMTTILDDQLYSHSDRLAGKVVLITGDSVLRMASLW